MVVHAYHPIGLVEAVYLKKVTKPTRSEPVVPLRWCKGWTMLVKVRHAKRIIKFSFSALFFNRALHDRHLD